MRGVKVQFPIVTPPRLETLCWFLIFRLGSVLRVAGAHSAHSVTQTIKMTKILKRHVLVKLMEQHLKTC